MDSRGHAGVPTRSSESSKYVYIDQKDLSRLAKGREAGNVADLFHTLVGDGSITVVLSFAHVIETARCTDPRLGNLLAEYADKRLGGKIWLLDPIMLSQVEVAACFCEYLGHKCRRVVPFDDYLLPPSLAGRSPRPDEQFRRALEKLRTNLGHHLNGIDRFARNWPLYRELGRLSSSGTSAPDDLKRKFALSDVPDATPQGVRVDRATKEAFVSQLDLRMCKATWLYYEYEQKLQASLTRKADCGECFDLFHIRAVPYCHMVTLDRETCDTIKQTRAGKQYVDRIAPNLPEALRRLRFGN
jgi:hypothetical protein